ARARDLRRSVGRVVVGDDELSRPAPRLERRGRSAHADERRRQQLLLVERGNDDRDFHYVEILTGVPAGTRSNSSTISALRIRMQPIEPGAPMGTESGLPWI